MADVVTPLVKLVLHASALILPVPMRREWIDEWRGEIMAAGHAGLGAELRMLPGVITDAVATRRHLRDIARARREAGLAWEGMMQMRIGSVRDDLRYAARALRARPGFTLVAIITLAIGVGATTSMFSAVHAVLWQELPYADAEEIVVLREYDTRDGALRPGISAANLYDVAEAAKSVGQVAMADGIHGLRLQQDGRAESLRAWVVSEGYFEALGAETVLGRTFLQEEYVTGGPRVVVLSHNTWQRRFGGDPLIIGQELILDDVARVVVGVLPPEFKYPSVPGAWTPRVRDPWDDDSRGVATKKGVARLLKGVTIEQAQLELDRIAEDLSRSYPGTNEHTGFRLISLRQHLFGDVQAPLTVLLGAVALVLLIASANVAGLQLARGASRSKEYAMRGALGATVPHVIRLVCAESMLLAAIGGALGIGFAYLGVEMIQVLGPDHLPRMEELRIDRTVLGFALVAALESALLSGIGPVVRASRVDLNAALSESSRGSTSGTRAGRMRDRLVVAEIALALVLVIGAGLLLRSFDRLLDMELGFEPNGLLAVQLWAYDDRHVGKSDYFEPAAEALRSIPGVESVGMTSDLPLADDQLLLARTIEARFRVEGRPTGTSGPEPLANLSAIDGSYCTSMGITLASGRTFSATDDSRSAPVVLINQAFAQRYFPDQDPIGQRLRLEFRTPRSWEIVGVLADVRRQGFESEPKPSCTCPWPRSRSTG